MSTPDQSVKKLTARERRLQELQAGLQKRETPPELIQPEVGIPVQALKQTEVSQIGAELVSQEQTQLIDPVYLLDNPYQKRKDYKNIESLADKMRQFGFKGSIPVRCDAKRLGHYQIAFGHRRVRAAILAGVQVRIEIEELSDEQMILLAISENYEREDLTSLEEGNGLLQLNEEFGMSQEAIAQFVGEERKQTISRGYVRNRINAARLARQYTAVRTLLEQNPEVSLRAVGYMEESLDERLRNLIIEKLRENAWNADDVGRAIKIYKRGGPEAETLFRATVDDEQNQSFLPDQATSVNVDVEEALPSASEIQLQKSTVDTTDQMISSSKQTKAPKDATLKRIGILDDALKRLRRYRKVSSDSPPAEDEKHMWTEIIDIGKQRLNLLAKDDASEK